ncbi:hypothetical protein UlMin_012468 [Ulmus minor]
MAHGGGSNNDSNRTSSVNVNNNGNGNRFVSLDSDDQLHLDDSNSSFHLSNGDHPGLSLLSNLLVGNNYNSWSCVITMALVAKNKLCFVDGSLPCPFMDDPFYTSRSRCHSMIVSWILHDVSKEIAESIMYIDNYVDTWNDLHDRFHQSNGPRIFQIKQLLSGISQGSSDVSSYFTKLKTLWDELK